MKSSGQQIPHRNLADLLPIDDQGNGLRVVVVFASCVIGGGGRPRRFGIRLDPAVDEVDNPIDGDLGGGVNAFLPPPVAFERRVGHFD